MYEGGEISAGSRLALATVIQCRFLGQWQERTAEELTALFSLRKALRARTEELGALYFDCILFPSSLFIR